MKPEDPRVDKTLQSCDPSGFPVGSWRFGPRCEHGCMGGPPKHEQKNSSVHHSRLSDPGCDRGSKLQAETTQGQQAEQERPQVKVQRWSSTTEPIQDSEITVAGSRISLRSICGLLSHTA